MRVTIEKSFEVVSLNGMVLWSFGYRVASGKDRAYNKAILAMNALYLAARNKGMRLVESTTTKIVRELTNKKEEKINRVYVGFVGNAGPDFKYGSSPRVITKNESVTRKMQDKAQKIAMGVPEQFSDAEIELMNSFALEGL